jgi:hypothetical protein
VKIGDRWFFSFGKDRELGWRCGCAGELGVGTWGGGP